jgi:hypothetical protein
VSRSFQPFHFMMSLKRFAVPRCFEATSINV